MQKYEWLPSESAPKNYPMQIIDGNFIFPDGNGIYIPSMKTIHDGWGDLVSTHIVGETLKPLPDKAEITFFSYTENKFYQAEFKLPLEKLERLFSTPYYSPKLKGDAHYDRIVIGVAPGGAIAVWVKGIDAATEIYFGKAEVADIPWQRVIDNDSISRDEFIQLELEESLDSKTLEIVREQGIPTTLWDTYHQRYAYSLDLKAAEPPVLIDEARYFNGELEAYYYPRPATTDLPMRSLPKHLWFFWAPNQFKPLQIEVNFDEKEIYTQFARLKSEHPSAEVKLEIDLEKYWTSQKMPARLRAGDQGYDLPATTFKVYSTKLSRKEVLDM